MPFLGFIIVGTWILWVIILIHITMPVHHVTVLELLLFGLIIFTMLPSDLLFAGLIILPFYIVGKLVHVGLWLIKNPLKNHVS